MINFFFKKKGYQKGEILSGQMKEELIKVLVPFVQQHQTARAKITDEDVQKFMKVRPLEFSKKKN